MRLALADRRVPGERPVAEQPSQQVSVWKLAGCLLKTSANCTRKPSHMPKTPENLSGTGNSRGNRTSAGGYRLKSASRERGRV